jgi:energy-coupling factor transport system permease protein
MSTTERDGTPSAPTTSPQDGAVATLLRRRSAVVQAVLGLLAAAVVLAVGLPDDVTVFGATLADLTLPAALLLVMVGLWAAGWTASRRAPWRVVDIVTASVLGVAFGLVFVVWNLGWATLSNGLAFFPPLSAVAAGVWLLPAVVGGLVVRRPGAAVYTELVAATLSALIGNQWGFATVWYGLLEGLGAEVVLALLLYRRFGPVAAGLAGAGAGVVVGVLDTVLYYPTYSAAWQQAYIACAVLSGAVVAGGGAWLLTRGLARSGALAPLASGRSAQRV